MVEGFLFVVVDEESAVLPESEREIWCCRGVSAALF